MPNSWDRPKRIAIGIALIGIAIEVVAVMLMASKRIPSTFGTPLVVTGMLLAFVPIFYLARQRRRR